MTVNEILEMFEELEYAAVQAVVSGCPLNRLNTAKEALKAAIEELHRDAAQASKLRDAVKFLLGTTVPATGQQEQCWIVLTDAMKEST